MASRIEPVDGVVDGVNRDFSVPSEFRPDSLVVFLNGQQLARDLDNGWEELDPVAGTFRMKIPPEPAGTASPFDPGDVLYAYFDLDDAGGGGGADGGIPRGTGIDVVRPLAVNAADLHPGAADAEGEFDGGVPLPSSALNLRPTPRSATVLRPKIAGSEET